MPLEVTGNQAGSSRLCRGSEASATLQLPVSKAPSNSTVSGAGAGEPGGGLQSPHTMPPTGGRQTLCEDRDGHIVHNQ